MKTSVERYHDFSMGHRVCGHEGACAMLHGHNYRVTFTCEAERLDELGRVIDFSVIKIRLCEWLEANWDHQFMMWDNDPMILEMPLASGVFAVDFNPTAENMAEHLLNFVGPRQLEGTNVVLTKVRIEETRKCSAEVQL